MLTEYCVTSEMLLFSEEIEFLGCSSLVAYIDFNVYDLHRNVNTQQNCSPHIETDISNMQKQAIHTFLSVNLFPSLIVCG